MCPNCPDHKRPCWRYSGPISQHPDSWPPCACGCETWKDAAGASDWLDANTRKPEEATR